MIFCNNFKMKQQIEGARTLFRNKSCKKLITRNDSFPNNELFQIKTDLPPNKSCKHTILFNKSFRTVAVRNQISIFTSERKMKVVKIQTIYFSTHFDTSFIEIR